MKLFILLISFALASCGGESTDDTIESSITPPEQADTDPTDSDPINTDKTIWSNEPGIPDDADELPEGTDCEEFSHVDHLPWGDRPSACPTGDWCMKKDKGFIEGAEAWYGLRALKADAIITCKIGNKCLRFVGMNNCHYDLYDPDTNKTLEPSDKIPWGKKDGHSYLNFRVRMPGSNTIHNFMSTEARAQLDSSLAIYCPADVYDPDTGIEPFLFADPHQGNQATGCGPDAEHIYKNNDLRDPVPYSTAPRNDYDWIYLQEGEEVHQQL